MMLLDTHVFIWYLTSDPQLPQSIKEEINNEPLVYVSSVVIWEIAIKGSLGKLELAGQPIDSKASVEAIIKECVSQEFEFLDIKASHAAQAPFFTGSHRDPFDRLLAAQAHELGSVLVSGDGAFDELRPEIRRLWAGSPPKKQPQKTRRNP